jgi:DNA modification methylase
MTCWSSTSSREGKDKGFRLIMKTYHKLIIGNCESMQEIKDNSMHLIVTSPPYFNAPFDYSGFYKDYDSYLGVLQKVSKEMFRVLDNGRILVLNIDDMLVDGIKYPITADATKILVSNGFRYRDRIIWKKPDGYLRISRRSGVLLQNPYPMYFYPDNLLESILIFQKGNFDHKSIPMSRKKDAELDKEEFKQNKWYSTLWDITNVLPGSPLEKGIAAFPDEIPKRAIKLFSYVGDNVLDPFLGSGTTMKVAKALGRNSVGIELNQDLIPIILKKCKLPNEYSNTDEIYFDIVKRGKEC